VTGPELAKRYGVPMILCTVWDPLNPRSPRPNPGIPHLYVDTTGKYDLPPAVKTIIEEYEADDAT